MKKINFIDCFFVCKLNFFLINKFFFFWCATPEFLRSECQDPDLNWGQPHFQCDALPTELSRLEHSWTSRATGILKKGEAGFKAQSWIGLAAVSYRLSANYINVCLLPLVFCLKSRYLVPGHYNQWICIKPFKLRYNEDGEIVLWV